MKNLVYFLLGVGIGAGGTFLWLHNELKKVKDQQNKKEDDVPFTAEDNKENAGNKGSASNNNETPEVNARQEMKTAYSNIVQSTSAAPVQDNGSNWGSAPVPVMPREEVTGMNDESHEIFEITKEDYLAETGDEKDYLLWYRVDHVLCEENGTIIHNPFMFIGHDWMNYVGHYAKDTAFVKNARLCTKYEIKCEEGLYTDVHGPYDEYEGE